MFVHIRIFDDSQRTLVPYSLKVENVQAIGNIVTLPSLKHPDGVRCRKVHLRDALWFWVGEADANTLETMPSLLPAVG